MTNVPGRLFSVADKSVVYTQPTDFLPYEWSFAMANNDITNVAADFAANSGLYLASVDDRAKSA